jgi:diacylglycerol kinase family enzyme
VKFGRHENDENVRTFSGRRISVEADPQMELNVDGEIVGLRTPAHFEVARRFKLLVPSKRS